MWDPFRYKLGGRLINGLVEEFVDRYGGNEAGKYTAARDDWQRTRSSRKRKRAGASPHRGVYLDFREVPWTRMRAAFAPVIDRCSVKGIDLTQRPMEVAPMAHYQIGGVRVNTRMETRSQRALCGR